jgi:hypothetical protein
MNRYEGIILMAEFDTHNYVEDEGISLIDLFLIVWRKKFLIVALSFLGLVLGGAVAFVMNDNNETLVTIVEYQWDGINNGEYPNGSLFEVSSAFTVNVYNLAIQDAGVTLTSNDIREELTITPIIPNNIVALIENSIRTGQSFNYFPTSFKYALNIGQLELSQAEGRILLNALIERFKTDFESKYIQKSVVLNYALSNIDNPNYDYTEVEFIFDNQLVFVENTIKLIIDNANNFVSISNTLPLKTFNDVLVQIDLLRRLELNNMRALINTYVLTKNVDRAVNRLRFENESKTLELRKQEQILTNLESTIENFSGTTQTVIIPGFDGTINTRSYLETLYAKYIETYALIAELEQDIAFNDSRIEKFLNPNSNINPEEQIEIVELIIVDLTAQLDTLVTNTNALLKEYNTILVKDIASNVVSPVSEDNTNVLLFAAIGLVLGGMISLGVVFVDHTMKQYKKNKHA